jgi:hypothetical protein
VVSRASSLSLGLLQDMRFVWQPEEHAELRKSIIAERADDSRARTHTNSRARLQGVTLQVLPPRSARKKRKIKSIVVRSLGVNI